MRKLIPSLLVVFLISSLLSCGEKWPGNKKTDSDDQARILATVNGVPITENDMRLSIRGFPHDEKMGQGANRNVLETLVRNELIYQKSMELGLDKNPEYRRKMNLVQAELRAYQRQEMSSLFRKHVQNQATVTDSEAQGYFEKHSKRIQTQFHLWQIFHRGKESEMAETQKDLKGGIPFEKVAARPFPKLPKGMKAPWDLGYLHWNQIPPPWQDVVDRLEPGQVSDMIKGPKERFWIIKLIDKKVDPGITFDTEKGKIIEVLRKQKADELYDATLAQMRGESKIVFPK